MLALITPGQRCGQQLCETGVMEVTSFIGAL